MNEHGPILGVHPDTWLNALRDITNATNERSVIGASLPKSGAGHTTALIDYSSPRAIASCLVLANMNSLPFDWAARLSVGATHLSLFIVKQLPVLPPEAYLDRCVVRGEDTPWVDLVVPRVVELTYTAKDLGGFAEDIGYDGPPFRWDAERRHHLQCELDAIYAHMYGLDRDELEWMLDAPHPGASFPTLKRNEIDAFGEYRTQRYVLHAYDQLARGQLPNLSNVP